MQKRLMTMEYYTTYHLADVVNDILLNQFAYLRLLEEFHVINDETIYVDKFPQYTPLHVFIEFCASEFLLQGIDKVALDRFIFSKENNFWLEDALNYHEINHMRFEQWLDVKGKSVIGTEEDDLYEYFQDLELDGTLDQLKTKMVQEVFFIVFLNRRLLQAFNQMAARQIESVELTPEIKPMFASESVLKRVRIPRWAQKAVFFRDRGACTSCYRDLSQLVSIFNKPHYDHIVPLKAGGINDVTNLQLLCETCNLKKSKKHIPTSHLYEMWY